ncbi:MAG: SGNH/GDSL hydrolase family protein [Candidatus Hydrogenedens sp.]|jgi:lysophospholipase L1-like esterase|nr:SGNH/GDSL hydrolase family protein [Candidatus Hydrogenedens sp.]
MRVATKELIGIKSVGTGVNDTIPTNESSTGLRISLLGQTVLLLLPVLLFFGIAEMGSRLYERAHPVLQVDIGQGFDEKSLLFQAASDGFMETRPEKSVSFQLQRFQMPKGQGCLRIFALGGSSVNYLNYEFSEMARELQQTFSSLFDRVEVINCGGLSYGTHRLVLIASEIMRYQPDLVLLYSGHNEFEELQQMHLSLQSYTGVQKILGKSAFYRLIRDLRARQAIARLEESHLAREVAQSIPDSSKTWEMVFTPEEISGRMAAYKNNLSVMIRQCREAGIPVVIGTVPSNLIRPNLPGSDGVRYEEVLRLYEDGAYEEALELGTLILAEASPRHQSSRVENSVIRELAQVFEVPLVDVEQAVRAAEPHGIPGETLFSDHCHLNEAGNRILRTHYQQVITELLRGLYAQEPPLGIQ